MITLKNQSMTVTIATLGAEMQTVTAADGTEYLWHGDPAWWSGRAPVLFPICGRLPNNVYRLNGKSYELGMHGFARRSEFEVETATDTEAVFLLRDSEATRAQYPFSFEFRVHYTLCEDTIEVTYTIDNVGDETMYASVGSHEAYACPEGLSAYDVIFETEEPLNSHIVDDGIRHETFAVPAPNGVLSLKDDYFVPDALVFRNLRSKSVELRNRTTGRGVRVAYPDAESLLIWSKPGAPYVCIEPWCGFATWVDFHGELPEKEGIRAIAAGSAYRATHRITLLP